MPRLENGERCDRRLDIGLPPFLSRLAPTSAGHAPGRREAFSMTKSLLRLLALCAMLCALCPSVALAQDPEPAATPDPTSAMPPEIPQPAYDVFRIESEGAGRAYRVWEEWVPQIVTTPDGGAWVFFTAQPRADDGYGIRRLFASRFDPELSVWLPARAIGNETTQFGASTAIDSKGAVHLVYSERMSDSANAWSQLVYQRFENGDWTIPSAIAPHPDAGHQMLASLAIGTQDDLHVVWRDQRHMTPEQRNALPTNADLLASDLIDDEWTEPVQINVRHAPDLNPAWPHLVADGDRLVVIWSVYQGTTAEEMRSAARVEWSTRPIDGTEWTAPRTLFEREAGDAGGRLIDLTADPRGGTVAIYGLYNRSNNLLYMQRLEQGSSDWSEPILLADGDYGYLPVATIAPDGTIYVVFNNGRNRDVDIGGLIAAPDGSNVGAVTLTPGEGGVTARASIALDQDGKPWVVYMHQPAGSTNVTEIQGVRAAWFAPLGAP